MRKQRLVLTIASVLLAFGTLMVFVEIDSHAHSVSDTIRPFIVTMAPIWAAFALTVWVAGRADPSKGRDDEPDARM